jgi:hypothetical protein
MMEDTVQNILLLMQQAILIVLRSILQTGLRTNENGVTLKTIKTSQVVENGTIVCQIWIMIS